MLRTKCTCPLFPARLTGTIRMSTPTDTIQEFADRDYKWGFHTDIDADSVPSGLNEDVIRLISEKRVSRIGSCSGG